MRAKRKLLLTTAFAALLGVGAFAGVSSTKGASKPVEVEAAYGDQGKITIYFAGLSGFSAITGVQIAVNNSWGAASATSTAVDQLAGQYKYQYTTNSNQTTLNAYITSHDGKDQWFHPYSGSKDWNTDYSTIKLGSTTPLIPGHSYVITFTSWNYNYDNWVHAWFNYSFSEFDLDDPATTTSQFYVYDPHTVLGSTFSNVKVYGFGQETSIRPMEWPGTHTGISQTTLGRTPMYSVSLSTSYPSFIMNNGTNQTGNLTVSGNTGKVLVIDNTKTGSDYNTHWDNADVYTDCPATDGYYMVGDANFVSETTGTGTAWKYSGGTKMNTLSGEGNKANAVLTVTKTVVFRVRSYFSLVNSWLNFGTTYDGTDGITTSGDNVQLAAGTYSIFVNELSAVYVAKGLPLDAFCSTFLQQITGNEGVCKADGSTDLDALKSKWSSMSTLYGQLTASAKSEIYAIGFNGGSDADDAHKVVKTYHYIVVKYGTANCNDFIWNQNITGSGAAVKALTEQATKTMGSTIAIIAITATSLAAVGGYFLFKKKKDN